MSLNTVTSSNQYNTPEASDGLQVGKAASSPVGFFGATPIAQPSGAAQTAVTDGSGGAAAPTNGVQPSTATYNSTILNNSIATILALVNAHNSALKSLGIIKGGA